MPSFWGYTELMAQISDLFGKWFPIDPPEKVKAARLAREAEDNASGINNLGHDEVTEDFEDSPYADREPIESDDAETGQLSTELVSDDIASD